MRSPREVFDNPQQHWGFLTAQTDEDFEGQYFDRKEASRAGENGSVTKTQVNRLVDQITECVSAFANANKTGGLLVLGIAASGDVKGINHLNDAQRTRITNLDEMLINQTARVEFVSCHDDSGSPNQICLIYVPHTTRGICETPGKSPKAWLRKGPQNMPMTHEQREQLRRDKKIVDFEQTYCCPHEPDDVDVGVLQEYRKAVLSEASYEHGDEQLLYRAGALTKDEGGRGFTNSGILFFASNPQRVRPYQGFHIFANYRLWHVPVRWYERL